MNSSNNNNYQQQPFLRTAEESYRNAFQSIESVVYAFSSISAMFESTFHALYNSFRAVIGVADQFYRVKQQLSNILSTFALFRLLKYLYNKLLRILKFNIKEDKDNLWNKINKNTINGTENIIKQLNESNNNNNNNSWPLLLFFGIIIGGPWLIWKLLKTKQKDDSIWMQGKIDHFIAVSEYDFDAENTDELSFKRGTKIIIAPKEYQPKMRGWLLGTIDGNTCGIMPANYLKLLGKKIGTLNEASQQEQLEKAYEHS
jgi:peroxin-13